MGRREKNGNCGPFLPSSFPRLQLSTEGHEKKSMIIGNVKILVRGKKK